MRVVLVGNPNVGKSVIFNRLTGIKVIISNYPGTTVEYLEGSMLVDGGKAKIVDAPGTYSLIPSDKAEEAAVNLLLGERTDLIVNVVDATSLERNLYLTLQLRELPIPMVLDLNMIDMARQQGITINLSSLREELKVPVVCSVAVSGEGIQKLRGAIVKLLKEKSDGDGI